MDARLTQPPVQPVRVYIGLGSNWQNPLQQLQTAVQAIQHWPHSSLCCVSSLYESAPLGPADQPHYLNAVLALTTILSPAALLHDLQQQERAQGRVRYRYWGERTLDLDVLSYDQLLCTETQLTLPHPQIAYRTFVLYPWAELVGFDFKIPGLGLIGDLLAACPPHPLMQRTERLVL